MKNGKILAILILFLSIISVNQYGNIFLGGTTINLIICFATVLYILNGKKYFFNPTNKRDYRIVTIYFIWMIIGVIRGIFIIENYWEWKQWTLGSLALTLPLFVYPFSNPNILQKILGMWIKWAIPLFFLFYLWVTPRDLYHFFLAPLLVIACFLPILPKKWQIITLILLVIMIFADYGARSQIIKSAMAILMSLAYLMSKYISPKVLKMGLWACYIAPVCLLFLGISGQFNIFELLSKNEGKYVYTKVVDGQLSKEDLSADTRTFLYKEVIISAIKNNYVLIGRTPARGNDSDAFGNHSAVDLKTGKYERHANEVGHLNVFTWLGLIGILLYSFIYIKSSYLAVYKSNNLFMKLVGVFIAFRWAYGWVEEFNSFAIIGITIWMMIAMSFSESFRSMNNNEFKRWIKNIFQQRSVTYQKY